MYDNLQLMAIQWCNAMLVLTYHSRIPLELIRASGGREVAINMSDHHHEDYTPTKPARKAFTGAGQTLGR